MDISGNQHAYILPPEQQESGNNPAQIEIQCLAAAATKPDRAKRATTLGSTIS